MNARALRARTAELVLTGSTSTHAPVQRDSRAPHVNKVVRIVLSSKLCNRIFLFLTCALELRSADVVLRGSAMTGANWFKLGPATVLT